jgi:hypothetical protein
VMAVVYRDWVGAGKGGVVVKRGGGAGTDMTAAMAIPTYE